MIQTPGGHKPPMKNRSSKQYFILTKCKSMYRSMSNEELNEIMNRSFNREARAEIDRRNKKHGKKSA